MTEPTPDYFGQATKAIATALSEAGIREHTNLSAAVDPPAVVIGPPMLAFDSYTLAPTGARYILYAVVGAGDYAIAELGTFLPKVIEAIGTVDDAGVTEAMPGIWAAANVKFPCYEITVDIGSTLLK